MWKNAEAIRAHRLTFGDSAHEVFEDVLKISRLDYTTTLHDDLQRYADTIDARDPVINNKASQLVRQSHDVPLVKTQMLLDS